MGKKAHALGLILFTGMINVAAAQGRLIVTAEADVFISEATPDRPATKTTKHLLSAGIGRGQKKGRLISYLRFDLNKVPHSTLLNKISIDSGQLRLLAHSFGLASQDKRFLVSVSYCPESTWSESAMTWNSRVCQYGSDGEDSVIIDGRELPRIYMWDVTRSLALVTMNGDSKVTFVVEAHRLLDCPRDPIEGKGCPDVDWVGHVRFSSSERSRFGVSAVPTLVVSHSSHPTTLMNFLNSMVAVLTALGVAAGLYEFVRRGRSKRGIQ